MGHINTKGSQKSRVPRNKYFPGDKGPLELRVPRNQGLT